MKTHPYNNNQGRWRDEMPRLAAPKELPELQSESVVGYFWIVLLIVGAIVSLLLVFGANMIARSFAAYQAKELVAEQICAEQLNMRAQWRYVDDSTLECSSAVTGDVRRVML
jgi:hypothetical protein